MTSERSQSANSSSETSPVEVYSIQTQRRGLVGIDLITAVSVFIVGAVAAGALREVGKDLWTMIRHRVRGFLKERESPHRLDVEIMFVAGEGIISISSDVLDDLALGVLLTEAQKVVELFRRGLPLPSGDLDNRTGVRTVALPDQQRIAVIRKTWKKMDPI